MKLFDIIHVWMQGKQKRKIKDKLDKEKRKKHYSEVLTFCRGSVSVMQFFIKEQKAATPHLSKYEILSLVLITMKTAMVKGVKNSNTTNIQNEYIEMTPEIKEIFKHHHKLFAIGNEYNPASGYSGPDRRQNRPDRRKGQDRRSANIGKPFQIGQFATEKMEQVKSTITVYSKERNQTIEMEPVALDFNSVKENE